MRTESREMHVRARRTAVLLAPLLAACFGGMGGGGVPAWKGPPFSADIVNLKDSTKPPSRLYLGDGKMRMESLDPASRNALVFDPAHNTTIWINEKDHNYIDAGMFTSVVAVAFAPLMRFIRPATGGDPCTGWNSTVDQFATFLKQRKSGPPPHFVCHSMGSENVDGRPAAKWAVTDDADKNSGVVWIDDRLQIVTKSMDNTGQMEMRNIKEGPQPAELFAPPAGYQKLGLTEMLGALGKAKNSSSDASSHP